MIEKIIFSGQILRKISSPAIDWFYNLLSLPIKIITNLPVYCCINSDFYKVKYDDYIGFDVKNFYSFYNLNYSNHLSKKELDNLWSSIFYNTDYNELAYEYIHKIFGNSLVITHEASELLLTAFNYFDISYIDINTDPIRFLEDQMFCFRSNNREIYEKILKYKYPEENIYLQANYLKTLNLNDPINLVDNSVLFCGQTTCDKTLIEKDTKTIYSILDHREDFKRAVDGYSKIYYKRHPYVKNDSKIIQFIKSLNDVEIIDTNIYKLFSSKEIKKVVSISSGVSMEGKYFGKECVSLLRESIPMQYKNTFDENKFISVFGDYFSLNFWSDILSPAIETKKFDKIINFSNLTNKLRNSRGYKTYWGYEDPEQEIIKEDIKRKFHLTSTGIVYNILKAINNCIVKFCCCFLFNKKNRQIFRKKYLIL